ncbi:MAG TPA: Fe2+-dependent dioxygenase [Gammaproteobacteria bacterium]
MMVKIPDVLTAEQIEHCRRSLLERGRWEDGRATAGHLAIRAKRNQQLEPDDPVGTEIGNLILDALAANPLFLSAALPLKVLPPRFNRYENGGEYGLHVDGAVLSVPGTPHRVRTDVSATLFLSSPEDYDGGELVIEDTYGTQRVKLPAGHLALYPGTSLHRVTPVTRGVRLASFFWIQSLVREDAQRALLFELDSAIQELTARHPDAPQLERLAGVYHNLVRRWSDT